MIRADVVYRAAARELSRVCRSRLRVYNSHIRQDVRAEDDLTLLFTFDTETLKAFFHPGDWPLLRLREAQILFDPPAAHAVYTHRGWTYWWAHQGTGLTATGVPSPMLAFPFDDPKCFHKAANALSDFCTSVVTANSGTSFP